MIYTVGRLGVRAGSSRREPLTHGYYQLIFREVVLFSTGTQGQR